MPRQVEAAFRGTETTHYVGGILEKVFDGSTTDWRHYIRAEGQVVAIVSRKSAGGNAVHYALEDNQGSGSTLVDSAGTGYVRQSYGAFGLPRDGSDWDGAVPGGDQSAINAITRRGYTGHSMLGAMGLIHMNGRVQDAITGRFLSPDPTIPDPGFTQNYNRYAYVVNNPLSRIDPSGFTDISIWNALRNAMCASGLLQSPWGNENTIVFPGFCRDAFTFTEMGDEDMLADHARTVSAPSRLETLAEFGRSVLRSIQDYYSDQKPQGGIPTSDAERQMLASNDVIGYYNSRAARGDAYAPLALDVVYNRGALGKAANIWMFTSVAFSMSDSEKARLLGDGTYIDHVRRVNIDLANQHMAWVDRDLAGVRGQLSTNQISQYHETYFQSLGLPLNTFGGSFFFGTRTSYWCSRCDSVP